jgi:hypothetical protein
MLVHAPTTYFPPSPISRLLSTPPSYLDTNLQVIQRPYITYEPIKSNHLAKQETFKKVIPHNVYGMEIRLPFPDSDGFATSTNFEN